MPQSNHNLSLKRLGLIAGLAGLAIVWRVINHKYGLAYNLEPITAITLLAALMFGWRAGLILPLVVLAVSDAMIGNSAIMAFTWSAFVLIGFGAGLMRKLNHYPASQLASSFGFAVISSSAFYVITNAGVWLQGYYAPGLEGLAASLAAGLPFYKTMLVGNLVLVPAATLAWQFYRLRSSATSALEPAA